MLNFLLASRGLGKRKPPGLPGSVREETEINLNYLARVEVAGDGHKGDDSSLLSVGA